jgi:cytochrome c-type biogenesis protein CcmH
VNRASTARVAAAVVAALVVLVVLMSGAAGAATRASFSDIEDEVMCVTCNVPLSIAESPQADAERRVIRRLIARGLTKQEIKDRLVVQYTPAVLAMPRSDGFGLTAYVIPIVVGLGLLGGLALLIPRWRRREPAPMVTTAAPDISAADERRLDEDLERYGR